MSENPHTPQTALGVHPVEVTPATFASLGLSAEILKSIAEIGFEHPTPIQAEVLPLALQGKDIIGLAQTGSGKTAAFVLPLAEKLRHGQGLRGLILCPTREIALQTKAFLDLFGQAHDLNTVCVIGGVTMAPQIRDLKNNPDILVATPGRLWDQMERHNTSLSKIEYLVLDEADHMFDLGFLPIIQQLLRKVPKTRQTLMFSATMPDTIEDLVRTHLTNPTRINILPKGNAAEGIQHRLYLVEWQNKSDALIALLNQELGSTLVFIETKSEADFIYKILKNKGHPVTIMHSDRSQKQRVAALEDFREGSHRILIATNIASRGIDVPGIEHVVNFDLPKNVQEYVHRAGRTARAGRTGLVSSIGTPLDFMIIKDIEKAILQELPRCTIPGVAPYVEFKIKTTTSRHSRRRR